MCALPAELLGEALAHGELAAAIGAMVAFARGAAVEGDGELADGLARVQAVLRAAQPHAGAPGPAVGLAGIGAA